MQPWYQTPLREALRASAMGVVLDHDETLLYFVFHHKELRLRDTPDELLKEARSFSLADFILIQCCIDLWSGEGNAKLSEILDVLDDDQLLHLIRGILHSREIGDERRGALRDFPC